MESAEPVDDQGNAGWGGTALLETVFTIVLAIAAVGTAWSGYQSSMWSGASGSAYADAGIARSEASRLTNEAGQQRVLDTVSFAAWIDAVNSERFDDPTLLDQGYVLRPETASGFLHSRFRDEFRVAFDAWVVLRPLTNRDAPLTPFAMEEYQLQAEEKAESLLQLSEEQSSEARTASGQASDYVLNSVLFALVLFFVALGAKTKRSRPRTVAFVLSLAALLVSLGVLATSPTLI